MPQRGPPGAGTCDTAREADIAKRDNGDHRNRTGANDPAIRKTSAHTSPGTPEPRPGDINPPPRSRRSGTSFLVPIAALLRDTGDERDGEHVLWRT